jgi:diguanylate cyclase (GGDEF)-like protein
MADRLSSVPDRPRLLAELDECIARSGHGAELIGLIVLKLGGLDTVNGELGNEVGDIVLSELYDRLMENLRPSDLAFRTSGSKFAVLIPSLVGTGQAELAIKKITAAAKQVVEVNGHSLKMSVNAGLAIYPEHAQHPQRLVYCAETALDSARSLSKPFAIYSKKQITRTLSVLSLETELEKAIDNGDIELHHQPKINLRTREITGVESLARWTSEVHGPVRPDVFIEIAERSGLILPFTLLTVNLALRQSRELQGRSREFSVAINLSAAVLNDPEICELIKRALGIWRNEPGQLTLEVTESAMMEDPKKSLKILTSLRSDGINISIDDFGTGYSSLSYLKRLPVDELKIDKSFVLNMMQDEGDAKIVKSVIDLAHNFDLAVVAEGVENQESLEQLAEMGCDSAQGFYIARPMPFEDLKKWLNSSSWGKQTIA